MSTEAPLTPRPEPEPDAPATTQPGTTDEGSGSARISRARISRDVQQEEAFTVWFNRYAGLDNQADSVVGGLRSGAGLLNLLTALGSTALTKRWTPKPRNDLQCLDNLQIAMDYIHAEGIKLVGIGAGNLFAGDRTLVLGLLYTLIIRYEVHRYGRDVRDLLRWVQEQCEPYTQRGHAGGGVPQNFTSDMQGQCAMEES